MPKRVLTRRSSGTPQKRGAPQLYVRGRYATANGARVDERYVLGRDAPSNISFERKLLRSLAHSCFRALTCAPTQRGFRSTRAPLCFGEPAVTYLEVIDTAVKVGLGALISGVSTYWMAKSKNRDDLRRERLLRHHGLLEKSAEQIENFSHVAMRYWALIVEWVRNRDQKLDLAPHRNEELTKTKAELFDAFSDLTSAESKLLLLGHTEAQKFLRNYGDLAKRMRRHAYDGNKSLTEPQMDEYRAQLLEAREKLFNELSRIYRSET